jgi:hypothetical protein
MKIYYKLKLAVTVILLCLITTTTFGQLSASVMPKEFIPVLEKKESLKQSPFKFGVGAELYASGNAHGAFYSLSLNISKNKSTFGIGPCLQKRSKQVNGIKMGYTYLLSGDNSRYSIDELAGLNEDSEEILQLRLFANIQYINNANLSYTASRVETITNPESTRNFNEVKLSTVEGALGAELDFAFQRFMIKTYMGGTVFYHTTYITGMYRERISPALIFGIGINIPHF